jgi:hypothetical protein
MSTWPSWWTIGIALGFGLALGILAAALGTGRRTMLLGASIAAVVAAAALGFLIWDWGEAIAGLGGALVGAVAANQIVTGAFRRGGTRAGLAILVALAAVVVAALALVPVLGYVETVVLPAFAARVRRRAPERYAGLRTLARD